MYILVTMNNHNSTQFAYFCRPPMLPLTSGMTVITIRKDILLITMGKGGDIQKDLTDTRTAPVIITTMIIMRITMRMRM